MTEVRTREEIEVYNERVQRRNERKGFDIINWIIPLRIVRWVLGGKPK